MFKKICVVTGSRCEYGLLYWLMKDLQADESFILQIVATGMHLSHEFGLTYRRIIDDGFTIDETVEMLLSSDTSVGITKSIGLGVIGFADVFARLRPDCVFLLGDRFETLAAAQAAFISKTPIAHIHGGELTMGAYDDGIRHSITKMSHLHFVATPRYRKRVIQLGEQPCHVHHVGPMVLDSLSSLTLFDYLELEKILNIHFNERNFVITYHPETLGKSHPSEGFAKLLQALSHFQNANFIFTKSNADTQGRIINDMIDEYCEKNKNVAKSYIEMGHQVYLSLLQVVDLAIGNSSSGIIEAPYFKIPSINIGDRQEGRERPSSVIDCDGAVESIREAIERGLSSAFKQHILSIPLPYGEGKISTKILNVLKNTDFTQLIKKQFYELA